MSQAFPSELIPTPLEVLCLYDEDVLSGAKSIHAWQVELLIYLGKAKSLNDPAVQVMLLAANGSGKSQMILAPFAIWMAMRFCESLTVLTNASGSQLDSQALKYITRMARKVNEVHKNHFGEGVDVFDCQYRKLKCNITDSYIHMFATDEAGKAEGWHPVKFDGEFAIITDESKTIADSIFEALERCTGFTRRLDVSSPGRCGGYFYKNWQFDHKGLVYKRKVTAFECPHLKQHEINEKIRKYGLHDPLIRSSIFAEFSSIEEQVVITRELIQKNVHLCDKSVFFGPLRAGLDLALGGDETVFSVWRGNVEVGLHAFRNNNAIETCDKIIELIKTYKGQLKAENIIADDGGLGRSTLDILAEKGYKVKRFLGQTRAFDSTRYANRAIEAWFSFKRFIEEYQVKFLTNHQGEIDSILFDQLGSRYFTLQAATNKMVLESKEKARKQNHPSPDRADAVILAWSNLIYPLEELNGPAVATKPASGHTVEELLARQEAILDREYLGEKPRRSIYDQLDKPPVNNNFSHRKIYPTITINHLGYARRNRLARKY